MHAFADVKNLEQCFKICPSISNNSEGPYIHTVKWDRYVLKFGPSLPMGIPIACLDERYHRCVIILKDKIEYMTIGFSRDMIQEIEDGFDDTSAVHFPSLIDPYGNRLAIDLVISDIYVPKSFQISRANWWILRAILSACGLMTPIYIGFDQYMLLPILGC